MNDTNMDSSGETAAPEPAAIAPAQATFLLEVLETPGLSIPLTDSKKLRLAVETKEALEAIAGPRDAQTPRSSNPPLQGNPRAGR